MLSHTSILTETPSLRHDPRMLTGGQIRAARVYLRWSAKDLAERAGIGIATVHRAEAVDDVPGLQVRTLAKLQRALEEGGIRIIDAGAYSGEGGPGIRLR